MKAQTIQHTERKLDTYALAMVLVIMLLSAMLLLWITDQRQADYELNQSTLAETSVTATANEISLTISELRRLLNVFSRDRMPLLQSLLDDPENETSHQRLQKDIASYFPAFFAFTLAQPDGTIILDDFEGNIGTLCRQDLKQFSAQRHANAVYVHPNANTYHFDIPVDLEPDNQPMPILFVSFSLDRIAQLLQGGQLPGHELILVNSLDRSLIEVTATGSRDQLQRDLNLDQSELQRIIASTRVKGTQWVLLDIFKPDLFSSHQRKLYLASSLIFGLVALISFILFAFLQHKEQKRQMAEKMIYDRNQELAESLATLQKTQQQLVEAEKLASLGELVAGVAHEINTPIGSGLTSVSVVEHQTANVKTLIEQSKLKKSDLDTYLEQMAEAGRILQHNLARATELVKSFKQIAVDRVSKQPRWFDMKTYLEEILLSLKPRLKQTDHLVELHCPDDLQVYSQPGALSQILTNLILNSLLHGFDEHKIGLITILVQPAGNSIRLIYTDNGKGITEEHAGKVFNPFFTTARDRGGSGLGLNIVYNNVRNMLKGEIALKQANDGGVEFEIIFPSKLAEEE